VIRFICDTPDRIPARIFLALRNDCACCTFWRGVALGLALSLCIFVPIAILI
jgi:hypothetical protein